MTIVIDLKKFSTITPVPTVALRLLEAMVDPELPIQEMVRIIKTDPAITAKILKSANASAYGGKTAIDSLDRCVFRLGKNTVGCLALSSTFGQTKKHSDLTQQHIRETWLRSVIQGLAMEYLARRLDNCDGGAAFVGGLLLDIGQLALIQHHAEQYIPIITQSKLDRRPLVAHETLAFGTSHAIISCELMKTWQFPDSLIQMAVHHELSIEELWKLSDLPDFEVIALANTASAVGDFMFADDPAGSLHRLETILQRKWQLDPHEIEDFIQAIRVKLNETAEMFQTDLSRLPSEGQLMASAMEQIANLTLQSAMGQSSADQRRPDLQQENENIRLRLEQLERRNCIDSLTQVYTRDYFDSRFTERLKSIKHNRALGVLFADVDCFKKLNDTHGHLVGDEVLKQVGALMKKMFRTNDVVARFGGEEFVVLLECPERDSIQRIADRLRQKVAEMVISVGDEKLSITISIGGVLTVSKANPDEIEAKKKQLVRIADEAMYECKKAGRNRCLVKELTDDTLVNIENPSSVGLVFESTAAQSSSTFSTTS